MKKQKKRLLSPNATRWTIRILSGLVILLMGAIYWQNNEHFLTPEKPFETTGKFTQVKVANQTIGIPGMGYVSAVILEGEPMYSYVAAGGWNGPLPPRGTQVTVSSPTGYMQDVVITAEDGTVYTCQGLCRYPQKQSFTYRVTNTDTYEVLCEETKRAVDGVNIFNHARCRGKLLSDLAGNDQPYAVQIWYSDDSAPPYITADN